MLGRAGPHSGFERNGESLLGYSCRCGGQPRHFLFRLLEDPRMVRGFGGDQPSRIICPGEFRLYSDAPAGMVPGQPSGLSPEQISQGRLIMGYAIISLEEVLKFIPPGEDQVPESAFTSARGKKAYNEMRSRYSHGMSGAVKRTYEVSFDASRRPAAENPGCSLGARNLPTRSRRLSVVWAESPAAAPGPTQAIRQPTPTLRPRHSPHPAAPTHPTEPSAPTSD